MYSQLLSMNGQKCYTLTHDNEGKMYVDHTGITIVYPTGNETIIPRSMVEEAIHKLKTTGILTVKDVHEGITNRNGPRTDRLMAVLRKLPGVTFQRYPRELYFSAEVTTR